MSKQDFLEVDEVEVEEVVGKKKEKKKKSKEERSKDRRTVFVVFLVMILVTIGFWFKAMVDGKYKKVQEVENFEDGVVLEEDEKEDGGLYIKYEIN